MALLNDALCEKIYSATPGAVYDKAHQGWVFPIGTNVSDQPTLALAVGERCLKCRRILGLVNVARVCSMGRFNHVGKSEFDVLGDTWLKGVYAIFDEGSKRFGVVQRMEGVQDVAVPK